MRYLKENTQDDDSGSRILQDPSGKILETHRILQENTGNGWKMEAVFRSKTARIFPVDSCQIPVLSGRKQPEIIGKIWKIPYRNTASMKSPECLGTGRFRAGMFDLGMTLL